MKPVKRMNGSHENGFYVDHEEVRAYIDVLGEHGVGSPADHAYLLRHARNTALERQAPRLRRLMSPGVREISQYEDIVARYGTGSGMAQNFRARHERNAVFRALAADVDARVREIECAEYERLVRAHGRGSELVANFRRRKWQSRTCRELADAIDRHVMAGRLPRSQSTMARGPA